MDIGYCTYSMSAKRANVNNRGYNPWLEDISTLVPNRGRTAAIRYSPPIGGRESGSLLSVGFTHGYSYSVPTGQG